MIIDGEEEVVVDAPAEEVVPEATEESA